MALNNNIPDVRYAVVESLGRAGVALSNDSLFSEYRQEGLLRIIIEALARSLEDKEAVVHNYAASYLEEIGRPAVNCLINILKNANPNLFARDAACRILGMIGKPAVQCLIDALKDNEDYIVRYYAVQALGGIADATALEALIKALGDKEPHVRSAAIAALGKIGDKGALDALEKAARDDDNSSIRIRAKDAIQKINQRKDISKGSSPLKQLRIIYEKLFYSLDNRGGQRKSRTIDDVKKSQEEDLRLLKLSIATLTEENRKKISKLLPVMREIDSLEKDLITLPDVQLKAKTKEFKARFKNGETLDQLLPEAFAVVREAFLRLSGKRIYSVQMLGGSLSIRKRSRKSKQAKARLLWLCFRLI